MIKLHPVSSIEYGVSYNGMGVGTVDFDTQENAWVALSSTYRCMGVAETPLLAALMLVPSK